jgi:hypothetical protein
MCVGLSGCLGNDNDKFIGTWKGEGPDADGGTSMINLTFFSDETGIHTDIATYSFNWEIKDEKLTLTYPSFNNLQRVYNYVFSDDNNKLTIQNVESGNTYSLTKQ